MSTFTVSERLGWTWYILLLSAVLASFPGGSVFAQPESRRFGVGATVGKFNGFSLKYYLDPDSNHASSFSIKAIDFNAAVEIGNDFSILSHVLFENLTRDSPLSYFAGPGILLGTRKGKTLLGGSTNVGILFIKYRFDVFIQAFPQLLVLPEFSGRLSWAVGLRYYF